MDNKSSGFFRFKDGKAYPWPGDVSSFILYPESANQTIYSQALGSVDAGNYTCTVTNESQVLTNTVALTVFGKPLCQIYFLLRLRSWETDF